MKMRKKHCIYPQCCHSINMKLWKFYENILSVLSYVLQINRKENQVLNWYFNYVQFQQLLIQYNESFRSFHFMGIFFVWIIWLNGINELLINCLVSHFKYGDSIDYFLVTRFRPHSLLDNNSTIYVSKHICFAYK